MKCCLYLLSLLRNWSLSSRRAWIEIPFSPHAWHQAVSLSSRRAWIEIVSTRFSFTAPNGRSPHGERGLKFIEQTRSTYTNSRSLSSRRAWIEIPGVHPIRYAGEVSLSSRRAWIEMQTQRKRRRFYYVALLTESVD